MTQEHEINPPPELIAKWAGSMCGHYEAARWGADQELEACCDVLKDWGSCLSPDLRAARRKPPSLKEQALQALAHLENGAHCSMDTTESAHYIRRALEQLDD